MRYKWKLCKIHRAVVFHAFTEDGVSLCKSQHVSNFDGIPEVSENTVHPKCVICQAELEKLNDGK